MPRSSNSTVPSRGEIANVAMTALIAPFIGLGKALERARPARLDRRKAERVAALLGSDVGEPLATLYTDRWKEARKRAAEMRRTEHGAVWRRLLDHQGRGWVYVRPLARVVEEAKCWRTRLDPVTAFYRFADIEIVDLFRYNAFRCADMVLGPSRTQGEPPPDDIDAETDAFYRNVSLLRLASAHRLAPVEFRLLANHLAGLDGWYVEFNRVFPPAAEAFYRVQYRTGHWRV